MQKYKSIWISDVHLGTHGCKAAELCNFLKNNRCETLYLVGDIVDGWKLSRSWNWPQEHSNVIRRILTSAKRGTKIVYIVGNHDEFLRSWLNHDLTAGNISIVNEYIHTDLKGRNWLIIHGDMFDQITVNWRWISKLGDRAYTVLLLCNGLLHKIRNIFGFGYWSLSKYIKSRTKAAINFVYRFEDQLSEYAISKNMYGLICGHIHTPALKSVNGIVYANDGDWVESCSALVETYDGEFQLLILSQSGTMEIIETH